MTAPEQKDIALFRAEVAAELSSILAFWRANSLDTEKGGFVGRLSNEGIPDESAPKGAVLNARILWTFSAAARQAGIAENRAVADRAYDYFVKHFLDQEMGGVYWTVTSEGEPLSTRKQIYALAFAIYGLSEYYLLTQKAKALTLCQELYRWIEGHSYDTEQGGYFEAFSREGTLLDNLRLSEKDRNDPKTMNTHLHILEAYANLYRAWPDPALAGQIRNLMAVFQEHIIDPATYHLRLFFTANWQLTADLVSYGHDIEAAWLLLEAAEVLGDASLIAQFQQVAIQMARAAATGLQSDGSLVHELDRATNHYDTHREWWVSAEAMVGFLNAWQLTKEPEFYGQALASWGFIQEYLLDKAGGEWRWGIFEEYSPMTDEDKIGPWKCPYHNARACMEVVRRLGGQSA